MRNLGWDRDFCTNLVFPYSIISTDLKAPDDTSSLVQCLLNRAVNLVRKFDCIWNRFRRRSRFSSNLNRYIGSVEFRVNSNERNEPQSPPAGWWGGECSRWKALWICISIGKTIVSILRIRLGLNRTDESAATHSPTFRFFFVSSNNYAQRVFSLNTRQLLCTDSSIGPQNKTDFNKCSLKCSLGARRL